MACNGNGSTIKLKHGAAGIKTADSPLEAHRLKYIPRINPLLTGPYCVSEGDPTTAMFDEDKIKELFPKLYGQPTLDILSYKGEEGVMTGRRLRIGVVLSGGPAAGGHNVITGLHDYLQERNTSSKLFGFLAGPSGITDGEYTELGPEQVQNFRNQGGFQIIGSGRTKISEAEQYENARKVVTALELDGLVVTGGDDSNTNAMSLAENFKLHGLKTCVVGCPKTIDNDLRNEYVETSFGFDTAAKVYANLIANLGYDAVSARKLYQVVRVMGRSASHLALECALQTHPNMCWIGEEVRDQGHTLSNIVQEFADLVCSRADAGKNYGLVILPEGLVEFMPDVEKLIMDLNEGMAKKGGTASYEEALEDLSGDSKKLFASLPRSFANQLILERDPHGNVQVAKIEAERLLISMVESELKNRKANGTFKGKFSAQAHYMGYEGRCALPTNFDANYCYGLGHVAGALIDSNRTGYIATLSNLTKEPEEWIPKGFPLTMMMNVERRKGKDVPVIKKMLVDTDGPAFELFKSKRKSWELSDDYRGPGPIQYYGPGANEVSMTLSCEAKYN